MMQAIRQLFSALTVLFSATEKFAKSLDDLATWTEEGTASFVNESRVERKKQLADLERKLNAPAPE